MRMLTKYMVQEAKSRLKNLVRQRCAEGFNSGVERLTTYHYPVSRLTFQSLLIARSTKKFNILKLYILPTTYLCCIISEQSATFSISYIHRFVFITEMKEYLLRGTNWVFK
jgi:predicted nucleotidyltransferase